ncbi:MAG: methylated-DNA--[protein]-cysteine S-methyltransferase [Calditrichaeota bacterium]|nr:methylated-DNA--[protein]-cysteine S-methyltransferase [Calditrichota bacterium]
MELREQDLGRMIRALRHIETRRAEGAGESGLEELARVMELSPGHAQRLFKRWAGVSPKRFQQYLSLRDLRARLVAGDTVEAAAWAGGLSGPGRLHDLMVRHDAVRPGSWRSRGAGLELVWDLQPGPFGPMLLACSPLGLCFLAFTAELGPEAALADLRARWPRARLEQRAGSLAELAATLFPGDDTGRPQLRLHLIGTEFQLTVWEALMRIPVGQLLCYERLAGLCSSPGAVRAVASGVGANPVSWLIPCHRVIRKLGLVGQYRWGSLVKGSLIAWEHGFLPGTERPGLFDDDEMD